MQDQVASTPRETPSRLNDPSSPVNPNIARDQVAPPQNPRETPSSLNNPSSPLTPNIEQVQLDQILNTMQDQGDPPQSPRETAPSSPVNPNIEQAQVDQILITMQDQVASTPRETPSRLNDPSSPVNPNIARDQVDQIILDSIFTPYADEIMSRLFPHSTLDQNIINQATTAIRGRFNEDISASNDLTRSLQALLTSPDLLNPIMRDIPRLQYILENILNLNQTQRDTLLRVLDAIRNRDQTNSVGGALPNLLETGNSYISRRYAPARLTISIRPTYGGLFTAAVTHSNPDTNRLRTACQNSSLHSIIQSILDLSEHDNVKDSKDTITPNIIKNIPESEKRNVENFLKQLVDMKDATENPEELIRELVQCFLKMADSPAYSQFVASTCFEYTTRCGDRRAVGFMRMMIVRDDYQKNMTSTQWNTIAHKKAVFNAIIHHVFTFDSGPENIETFLRFFHDHKEKMTTYFGEQLFVPQQKHDMGRQIENFPDIDITEDNKVMALQTEPDVAKRFADMMNEAPLNDDERYQCPDDPNIYPNDHAYINAVNKAASARDGLMCKFISKCILGETTNEEFIEEIQTMDGVEEVSV